MQYTTQLNTVSDKCYYIRIKPLRMSTRHITLTPKEPNNKFNYIAMSHIKASDI